MASDNEYKKIIQNCVDTHLFKQAASEFSNLAMAIEKYRDTPKSEHMLIKSLLIEKMADAEIFLKLLKMLLDMNNNIGTGVLTSIKRKKMQERLRGLSEKQRNS